MLSRATRPSLSLIRGHPALTSTLHLPHRVHRPRSLNTSTSYLRDNKSLLPEDGPGFEFFLHNPSAVKSRLANKAENLTPVEEHPYIDPESLDGAGRTGKNKTTRMRAKHLYWSHMQ